MSFTLSIIIPTLNEEAVLEKTLSCLLAQEHCEVIVVDGGSSDATLGLAEQAGCTTITSARGRGKQMNLGADRATGEVLLFLHADTLLPENFSALIFAAVNRPDVAAGAFSLSIDSPSKSLAFIAWMANLRSRLLHLPYGDQALFTTRKEFFAVGGFPEIEIMEDFVFLQKIKKNGRILILPECVKTSARRWQNMGILQTTVINQLIIIGYRIGVSPALLAGWYRRLRGIGHNKRKSIRNTTNK